MENMVHSFDEEYQKCIIFNPIEEHNIVQDEPNLIQT